MNRYRDAGGELKWTAYQSVVATVKFTRRPIVPDAIPLGLFDDAQFGKPCLILILQT